jgi:hypothetical protein
MRPWLSNFAATRAMVCPTASPVGSSLATAGPLIVFRGSELYPRAKDKTVEASMLELDLGVMFRMAIAAIIVGGIMIGLWRRESQATKETCAQ